MHDLVYAERFIDDMCAVYSPALRTRIFKAIELLRDNPELGSAAVPRGVTDRFGTNVRRLVEAPFLIVYKIVGDEVWILGLMHSRQAY